MILVTVGTQLPFDRLLRAVDDWAGRSQQNDIVAQIGLAQYSPRHMRHQPFMSPAEFVRRLSEADLIISHAGMGTILSALERNKPILVMPRLADLGEHRNDHQLSTVRRLQELGLVEVAMDEKELVTQLDSIGTLGSSRGIGSYAADALLNCVREFIKA